MAKRKYRVGVIGCGGTSGHFFSGWGAWPELTEVAAICDVLPSQMDRRQADFPEVLGKALRYVDYHKMLAEADLDIVCICSFSDRHLEHAEDCMAAGKHVFVEKPVGYDLEEARRFKYLCAKHPQLKVAVAYSLRYYKAYMDLRGLIRQGVLGEILSGEISYSHGRSGRSRGPTVDEAGDSPSRRRPEDGSRRIPYQDRGGNYIRSSQLSHATHPWDLARYLLGEAKEVFATRGKCGEMGMVWMESGAICHVLAGSVRGAKIGYMQQQIAQIHGTEGTAWLTRDRGEPYAWRTSYKTDGDVLPAPSVCDLPESSHGATIRSKNLLDAIEGKAELICSAVDGATTTELLHAVWLSQRMQVKVPVLPANHSG